MVRLLTHALARLLPRELRDAHGDEIRRDIDRRFVEGRRLSTLTDVAAAVLRERRRNWLPHRVPSHRTALMSQLLQDLRFAARMLKRQPGFALAVIVTLGLGIGSATAVISLADATLLRPVPAHEPHRLVEVHGAVSFPDYRDLQRGADVFEGMLAYGNLAGISFDRGGSTRRVAATLVSGNYFDVLGIGPAAGRLLSSADETAGGIPSIVISERLWRSAFDRAPPVAGEPAKVNGRPVTVVGVVPDAFKGLSLGNVGDVWMPAVFAPELATGFIGRPAALTRDMTWLRVIGRLRSGVEIVEAANAVTRVYDEMHPLRPGQTRQAQELKPISSTIVTTNAREGLGQFVRLLFAVAAILMLLGCANVANLLLARAASRRQEVGVRIALGAGRTRIMTQLLVESSLLGVLGAAAGLAIAAISLRLLGQYRLPGDVLIADLGLRLDTVALGSAVALAGIAVTIFGLFPAWLTSRREVNESLRQGGRTATRIPLGRTLVTLQVALSLSLVGGGLLFVRGLQHAMAFDLGYEPAGVVMTTVDPSLERIRDKQLEEYVTGALERLRTDGTIRAAGAAIIRPMRGDMTGSFHPLGYQPSSPDDLYVSMNLITEGWTEAIGLPLLGGRSLRPGDRTAPQRVALVSDALARKIWPGRDPIGQRLKMDKDDPDDAVIEVVGVVGNIRRYGATDAEPKSHLYLPLFSPGMAAFRGQLHVFARSEDGGAGTLSALRAALQASNPRVPIFDSMTLSEHVAAALMPQRLGLLLLAIFSIAALVLAAAGVYAIAAYMVSSRRREIGIRMALGAGRGRVLRQVVRDVSMPVIAGIAAGLAIQLWTSKLAESFVFGLDARAPLQLAAAVAIVIAAAMVALSVPARRAARVDPAIALRES